MALCNKFEKLNPMEKWILVGELAHAIQSDDEMFEMAQDIITIATLRGLYKGITLMPDREENPLNDLKTA